MNQPEHSTPEQRAQWESEARDIDGGRLGFEARKANMKLETWMHYWKPYPATSPEEFQIVAVLAPENQMRLDWLESVSCGVEGKSPDAMYFSDEGGPVKFWMELDLFYKHAPKWAQEHCMPLTNEALNEHARRSQSSPGDTERLPLDWPDIDTVPAHLAVYPDPLA